MDHTAWGAIETLCATRLLTDSHWVGTVRPAYIHHV